ncbi:MAG: hypothetical protein K6T83_00965 [Alicyclobacillus sp.]|nr:hypothetical protein [Alicyclobacillus sp.]
MTRRTDRTVMRIARLKQTLHHLCEAEYGSAAAAHREAHNLLDEIVQEERRAAVATAASAVNPEREWWYQYQRALYERARHQQLKVAEVDHVLQERSQFVQASYIEAQRWKVLSAHMRAARLKAEERTHIQEADEHVLNRFGRERQS